MISRCFAHVGQALFSKAISDFYRSHSEENRGEYYVPNIHYVANQKAHTLSILIADDGIGVQASLAKNEKYRTLSEAEALKLCIEDNVTDGAGMGFGLYATSNR